MTSKDILPGSLKPNEVFVFGSNTWGQHRGGAALFAYKYLGAPLGKSVGHISPNSYAIPTLAGEYLVRLPLETIAFSVIDFIAYAKKHPELTFLVTEVGCGIAGFSFKTIAPMFAGAVNVKNIHLPASFWVYLDPFRVAAYLNKRTGKEYKRKDIDLFVKEMNKLGY
jgi:hypothetical protein